MPLLKYEAEVFIATGAWKSLLELEENLTLEELFLLYRASSNEYTKQIKVAAMAAGAEDIDFDEDWFDPEPPKPPEVIDSSNIMFIPIGLGYEA